MMVSENVNTSCSLFILISYTGFKDMLLIYVKYEVLKRGLSSETISPLKSKQSGESSQFFAFTHWFQWVLKRIFGLSLPKYNIDCFN